jgi:hypothetical protein
MRKCFFINDVDITTRINLETHRMIVNCHMTATFLATFHWWNPITVIISITVSPLSVDSTMVLTFFLFLHTRAKSNPQAGQERFPFGCGHDPPQLKHTLSAFFGFDWPLFSDLTTGSCRPTFRT